MHEESVIWARFSQGATHSAACCAGYMVSRMLGAAPVLADAVVEQLCRGRDAAADAHRPLAASSEAEAEGLSAAVWHAIWAVERCRARARQAVTPHGPELRYSGSSRTQRKKSAIQEN